MACPARAYSAGSACPVSTPSAEAGLDGTQQQADVDHRSALMRNALPIGPGSLLWENFGDMRLLLGIYRLGLIQNMHPAVSRALVQHSGEIFLTNPWNRLLRSIPPILGVVYDPTPDKVGRKVRDYHVSIKGELDDGTPYHALNPETFFWTHATFFQGVIHGRSYFGKPFTQAEKEQLYRESITWYSRYGLSMRPVPADYAAFERYWDGMIETLQPTPITTHALNMGRTPRPFDFIPHAAWRIIDPLLYKYSLWYARGALPDVLRQRLGMGRWSKLDEALLRSFALLVRALFAVMPTEWRYLPTARMGRKAQMAKNSALQNT